MAWRRGISWKPVEERKLYTIRIALIAVRVNVLTPYECSHIPYEENPIVRAAISVQDQARLLVFISERLFALSLSPKTINRDEYNSFPLTKRYCVSITLYCRKF